MLEFDFKSYTDKVIGNFDRSKYFIRKMKLKDNFFYGKYSYFNKIDEFITMDEVDKIMCEAEFIRGACDVFVVVGTGGSSVGSDALISALSSPYVKTCPEIIYIGDNLSSISYADFFEYIEGKEVVVNLISKSGSTLEVMMAFDSLLSYMKEKYSEVDLKSRIIITTDSDNDNLVEMAKSNGYKLFSIPHKIGGRFSVLTSAGVLPMAVAGVDIISLLEGYSNGINYFDDVLDYVINRDILFKRGKSVEIFALYEKRFLKFGEWLKQLFAETQGKNCKGIIPISCINTKDLHSMGQAIQEGNPILFETALGIVNAPLVFTNYNKDLNMINNIALLKTAEAHLSAGCPTNVIMLDKLDEFSLGEVIYFFMISAVAGAILLNVDPLNQPGVEKYKELIRRELL